MIDAIDPHAVVEHTLEGDTDDPSVFLLRPLTARERLAVLSHARGAGSTFSAGAEAMEAALLKGLVGWRNFPAEWDARDMQANLDRLPDEAYAALADRVLQLSRLSRQEKKA